MDGLFANLYINEEYIIMADEFSNDLITLAENFSFTICDVSRLLSITNALLCILIISCQVLSTNATNDPSLKVYNELAIDSTNDIWYIIEWVCSCT